MFYGGYFKRKLKEFNVLKRGNQEFYKYKIGFMDKYLKTILNM